jgi:cytochrome P450
MIAGRDTTAAALTWLFRALSQNPTIEAKCASEVTSILHPSVQPTPETMKSLTYLEATFMETCRLHPPVPADMKMCVQTCRFPSGEVVTAGSYILFTPSLVNVYPAWYEASTTLQHWSHDCTEFKPQRWLVHEDGRTKILNPPSHEFVVFNSGPRLCLGKSMAILEGKTLAASILQTFHIQVRKGYEPLQRIAPVVGMVDGLPVTVSYRQ